jgi:hypothetical protein
MLAQWLAEQGRSVESGVWRLRAEEMWTPDIEAYVNFGRRAFLKGVSVKDVSVSPGQVLGMDFLWSCAPRADTHDLVVFVHFKRGKDVLFQDDRPFLEDQSIQYQPFDEVFVERRLVRVPYEAPPGQCEVWIGVYDARASNRRLSCRSALKEHNRSVMLPLVLEIENVR